MAVVLEGNEALPLRQARRLVQDAPHALDTETMLEDFQRGHDTTLSTHDYL